MTSKIIQFPPLHDFNAWAYFWYYNVGVNVIPTNAEEKKPIVVWSPFQNESISEELFIQWINQGFFKSGMGVITGKIRRGKHVGKYLTAVDLDNRLAIDEFSVPGYFMGYIQSFHIQCPAIPEPFLHALIQNEYSIRII